VHTCVRVCDDSVCACECVRGLLVESDGRDESDSESDEI
jgi:hypothetical protein